MASGGQFAPSYVYGQGGQDSHVPVMQSNYLNYLRQENQMKRHLLDAERQNKAQRSKAQKVRDKVFKTFGRRAQVQPTYAPDFRLQGGPAYGYHPNTYDMTTSRPYERHGPVNWEQYFPQWDTIGTEYNEPILNAKQIKFFTKKNYSFIKKLGEGGYGQVWLVRKHSRLRPNRHFACKVLSIKRYEPRYKVRDAVTGLLHESEIMKDLFHANIVRQSDVINIDDEVTGFPYCALFQFMELMDGSLYDLVMTYPDRKMCEDEAKVWFKDVSLGLKYLHDNNISHLDIKPQNILYKVVDKHNTQLFKLTDFGLSLKFQAMAPSMTQVIQGTRAYMAPEQFLGHAYETKSCDIFSLAATLSACLLAVDCEGGRLTIFIRNWNLTMANKYNIQFNCHDLVEHMCRDPPNSRWTIDQVLASDWLLY